MPRDPFNFNKVTVTVKVRYKPPNKLLTWERNARELARPGLLESLVKQAIAETLLRAYRQRFLSGLGAATTMERVAHRPPAIAQVTRQQKQAYLDAVSALDQSDPSSKGRARARAELLAAERRISRRLKRRTRTRRKLSEGRFRGLALKVLRMATDLSDIAVHPTERGVLFGVGNIAELDTVETPTVSPKPQNRKILWRHLEFGTGVYSTDKRSQLPYHRLPGGGWWFGQSVGHSLHLKGSRPLGAWKDPDTMMRYSEDYLAFRDHLARAFGSALMGR